MSFLQNFTGSGVGGAITATFRDGYQIWEIIRGNFNTLNAAFMGQGTGSPEGVVSAGVSAIYQQTDGATGKVLWLKVSGSGNTGWVIVPVSASIMTFKHYWPMAQMVANTAVNEWDTDSANDPTPTSQSGSNQILAGAVFPDAATTFMQRHLLLPSDWSSTGGIDLRLLWKTTATTGNAVWQIRTGFVADAAALDVAYNAAQVITDATQGTASRLNIASLTALTLTGAAASSLMFLQVKRDPTHASDTIAADAALIGVELTYRRTVTLA